MLAMENNSTFEKYKTEIKTTVNTATNKPSLLKRLFLNPKLKLIFWFTYKFIANTMNCFYKSSIIRRFT